MADNLGVTPGSGASVAADDVGGNLFQRVKLALGDDGVSEGDVSSNLPMPVALGQVQLALNRLLNIIANPTSLDPLTGRMRVVLDATGGAQTLGTVSTVTTVSTLTNMSQIGGIAANTLVLDTMHSAWVQAVRGRIS